MADDRQQGAGSAGEGPRSEPEPRPSAAPSPAGSFELEGHLFYWMTKVMGRRDRQLADELRRFGLRVTEWRLLALVHGRRLVSIGEAATDSGVDHTTMSRITDRMVRDGTLLRVADATDMRVTRLALTGAGEDLVTQVWPVVDRLNREALARLPEGSIPLLCLAFGTICQTMEESWLDKGARKGASA